MRTNKHGELMRIKEIRMQPADIAEPRGEWKLDFLWQSLNEKSSEWYGCEITSSTVNIDVKNAENMYVLLAELADNS